MQDAWTISIDERWIAWLTFDVPDRSVNVFSERSLAELDERLAELEINEAIKAVAIRSGKDDSFIVGADIDELASIENEEDALYKSQGGHAIFARLAALPVPTVAVIHGNCLGGGLEFSLACTYRLVTGDPATRLGLPEVNLGILPGWGGTQRLPRLIGLPAALGMILTGRPVDARKARRLGLADGTVAQAFMQQQAGDFIDTVLKRSGRRAVERKRRKARGRVGRLLSETATGRAIACRSARRSVMKKTHGNYPAPLEALAVMRRTAAGPLSDEGVAIEQAGFAKLACTPISRNLVWLFQSSQRLRKLETGKEKHRVAPKRGAVVGAGIMGGGIAWAMSSRAGIPVRLKDISWDAVESGMAAAARMNKSLLKRRRMLPGEMSVAMHRIHPTLDYTGFEGVDVVVEAVVENLAIKQHVLREIEQHVAGDTIIATNTSSLPLADLQSALSNPKRFVGLHFFNPVNRMPLVEVVGTKKTSARTIASAVELVKAMGKTPVVVGDCAGFLVNRILLPYLIESAWMFQEGVALTRIDQLLERFGMPMGPLALVDEVGIDVGYKVACVLERAYGDRMHVPDALGAVVDSGELLGRKSGMGFYRYEKKGDRTPNPDVTRIVEAACARDGITVGAPADETIVDRAILIMVNEAARCLEEGVVEDAESLDMAMVMGTGFAPFRGGLLRYADELGLDTVARRLEELAAACGERFEPTDLIRQMARRGDRFHNDAA